MVVCTCSVQCNSYAAKTTCAIVLTSKMWRCEPSQDLTVVSFCFLVLILRDTYRAQMLSHLAATAAKLGVNQLQPCAPGRSILPPSPHRQMNTLQLAGAFARGRSARSSVIDRPEVRKRLSRRRVLEAKEAAQVAGLQHRQQCARPYCHVRPDWCKRHPMKRTIPAQTSRETFAVWHHQAAADRKRWSQPERTKCKRSGSRDRAPLRSSQNTQNKTNRLTSPSSQRSCAMAKCSTLLSAGVP